MLLDYIVDMIALKSRKDHGITLKLPKPDIPILGHLKNIEYCIEQIKEQAGSLDEPVIGYRLGRVMGAFNTQLDLEVLSFLEAGENQKRDPRFNYVTLILLSRRLEEIKARKYNLDDGLIVSMNPAYQA